MCFLEPQNGKSLILTPLNNESQPFYVISSQPFVFLPSCVSDFNFVCLFVLVLPVPVTGSLGDDVAVFLFTSTNCSLQQTIVFQRDWLLFTRTGTVWHSGLDATTQNWGSSSGLTQMHLITCCQKRRVGTLCTRTTKTDSPVCFILFSYNYKNANSLSKALWSFWN